MRAVHWPQDELLCPDVHRRVHVVAIVGPVARAFVQLAFGHLWRIEVLVPVAPLQIDDETLDLCAHRGSGRHPYGKPAPHASSLAKILSCRPSRRWSDFHDGLLSRSGPFWPAERRRTSSPEATGPGDVACLLLRVHAGRTRRRRGYAIRPRHMSQTSRRPVGLGLEYEEDDGVAGHGGEREQSHDQRADVVVEIEKTGAVEARSDDE